MKPVTALAGLALLAVVHGHGAMVHPRSRNSVDYLADVPPADKHTFASCVNVSGTACENGQSAYWYSQGCAFLSPLPLPPHARTPNAAGAQLQASSAAPSATT